MDNKAQKSVSSHHTNSGVFFERYKTFERDPYSNAFTYDRKRLFTFLLEFIDENLVKNSKILEVGSGTGYFLNLLKQKSFDVRGVEPASGMRAHALSEYPGLNIQEAGVNKLPFADQTFDAVFGIEVFRYLSIAEQESGYRECLRVLKPGGVLVVTLVNRYALDGFLIKYKFFSLLEKLGIRELPNYCDFKTPSSIKSFIESCCGVTEDKISTIGVLFAPIRLAYKISAGLGQWMAKRLEKFDEKLVHSKFHKCFAGYLVLIVRK